MLVPVAEGNPKNGMEAEVFTVSTVIDEVVKVPWPRLSRRRVPFIKRLEPILKLPVVVPTERVVLPSEEEVFTMRVPTFKLPELVAFVKTVLPRDEEVFTVRDGIGVVGGGGEEGA